MLQAVVARELAHPSVEGGVAHHPPRDKAAVGRQSAARHELRRDKRVVGQAGVVEAARVSNGSAEASEAPSAAEAVPNGRHEEEEEDEEDNDM